MFKEIERIGESYTQILAIYKNTSKEIFYNITYTYILNNQLFNTNYLK